jgi:ubiquinone/menaquinone biosynthesis C-methylase UbiE
MNATIERYYDEKAQTEWERLEQHRTEFAVTMRALGDYLPPPPASVLDIGGGPGRYAITLAQQGYPVTLVDLSGQSLELARLKAAEVGVTLADIMQGNALHLTTFADESFDAVLMLGPLYHLQEESERQQAIMEARRVLKPGGILCAAFIGRYAALLDLSKTDPAWIVNRRDISEQILATGRLTVSERSGFTTAYLAHPTEVKPLMEGCGLTSLDQIGVEGVISLFEDKINPLEGELWEAWVAMNYRLGKDPSLHGVAQHLLWVGHKGS